MKKTMCVLAAALALGGCSGAGMNTGGVDVGGTGMGLVKMFVQNQCVAELQQRNEWRLIALAMSAQTQQEWENKICGCASEEVPKQISAADFPRLLTEEGRTQVAADVTAKTVSACFKRLYSK